MTEVSWPHLPLVAADDHARRWLQFTANLGRARNTIEAYARALDDHLRFCRSLGADPLSVRPDVIVQPAFPDAARAGAGRTSTLGSTH
jgi:integrase/recombinase XerD